MIGYEILPDFDVISVITPQGRIDHTTLPDLAQKLLQDTALRFEIHRLQLIVLMAQALCPPDLNQQLRIGPFKAIPVTKEILAATGGLAREAYYDGGDLIAVIDSEKDLAAMVPDYDAMCRIEGRGLIITAASREYDFVSRCFYPKLNVPEDPVTGSAHTYLTPLWAGRLGKTEMVARQLSPRGGLLRVRLEGQRVSISGNAVLFMQGEIPFDL